MARYQGPQAPGSENGTPTVVQPLNAMLSWGVGSGGGEVLDALNADERYRLLINSITDYAIYMLDSDGRVTSWNPGAERFKGYTECEIIGRHFSLFYTDEDQVSGLPAEALRQAAAEGRFEREGWRVRKDGSRFWAHVVIDPIRSNEGRVVGFAKITRDLTERRAAEQALNRSQEQFRLLVQGVSDYAIYLLDPDGHVSSWNSGAERIKGFSAEEVIGRHFSEFYTEEDRKAGEPEQSLWIAKQEGHAEREGWRLRKDGCRFWAHVVIDAIHDYEGRLLGFAKVTRDTTEKRESEEALERTREALAQAQKMEAIGQLTGGIAHDFNNILAAIMGSVELALKRLPEDQRVTPLLNNALQGAQRGALLTQRMLAFARKQELNVAVVDLPMLVRGMAEFADRSLGPQVEVLLEFPERLPKVRADANQLEIALLNLMVNARDAMGGNGIITISASPERCSSDSLPRGEYVRLEVADTGIGMDEATRARAQEPFFTTKGLGAGTGLGLSMAHGFAAQSGGKLEIVSAPGTGTSVTIWLPVAATADVAMVRPVGASQGTAPERRLRLLVVDDDPLVLSNTVALLEELKHEVVSASSGKEALSALKSGRRFDMVLTDYAMPHLTGADLAAAASEMSSAPPFGIMTGYADLPRKETLNLPRLAKPFSQDEVDQFVRAIAAGR
jgi:PAS domain S-box-containing protein